MRDEQGTFTLLIKSLHPIQIEKSFKPILNSYPIDLIKKKHARKLEKFFETKMMRWKHTNRKCSLPTHAWGLGNLVFSLVHIYVSNEIHPGYDVVLTPWLHEGQNVHQSLIGPPASCHVEIHYANQQRRERERKKLEKSKSSFPSPSSNTTPTRLRKPNFNPN